MPEKKAGLRAKLSFDEGSAIAGMGRASGAFARLTASAKMAQKGIRDIKAGFAGLNAAAVGMAAVGGLAVKKFSSFAGQFGAVKAVLGEAAEKSFPALEAKALELGRSTSFTAKQAAEAMENLARAGLKPAEILDSISPVLDSAAAEGIDLATAASLVSKNMKAFGLDAKDAADIADTLAFTSAKTNSTMVSLGEGLKFVAPISKKLGVSLQDTTAFLGALGDVGLEGTLAGTAMKNALLKLAAAAKRGKVQIKGVGAVTVQAADGSFNLQHAMGAVNKAIGSIKNPLARANALMEVFGLRGMGADSAMEALAGDKDKMKTLFNMMQKGAKGASKRMAEMRLDNIHGDFVRLSSAVDGAAIALGRSLAPVITPLARKLTDFFTDAAKGNSEFVKGLKEGIQEAKAVFAGFIQGVRDIGSIFGMATPNAREFIRTLLKISAVAVSAKIAFGAFRRIALVGKGMTSLVGAGAKLLGRGGAGAAGKLADSMATPVRVVNFHEAGLGSGGTASGAAAGAAGTAGKAGKLATALGFAKKMLGRVALPAYVAHKVSQAAEMRRLEIAQGIQLSAAKRLHAFKASHQIAKQRATELARLSASGGTAFSNEFGKRFALTRASARARVLEGARKGGATDAQIKLIMGAVEGVLQKIPEAISKAQINVKANIDGREAGKAVTKHKNEAQSRVRKLPPGARSAAARQ